MEPEPPAGEAPAAEEEQPPQQPAREERPVTGVYRGGNFQYGYWWADQWGTLWACQWHRCRHGWWWRPPNEWWHADLDPMELLRRSLEVLEAPGDTRGAKRYRRE